MISETKYNLFQDGLINLSKLIEYSKKGYHLLVQDLIHRVKGKKSLNVLAKLFIGAISSLRHDQFKTFDLLCKAIGQYTLNKECTNLLKGLITFKKIKQEYSWISFNINAIELLNIKPDEALYNFSSEKIYGYLDRCGFSVSYHDMLIL